MKITAEFNSNEELISFIGAFGAKSFIPSQGVASTTPVIAETKKEDKPAKPMIHDVLKESGTPSMADKEEKVVPTKEAETLKEEAPKDEVKVTKEMVRERLGAIMKAGKQAEAKELVKKHGATGIPTLKEEEYAAVYQEAEVLL